MATSGTLKKLAASALSLCLTVTAVSITSSAEISHGNGNYIFNSGVMQDVCIAGGNGHLVTVSEEATLFGDALNIKPMKTCADGWAQIPATVYDDSFSFSDTAGIAMYVKIPDTGSVSNIVCRIIKTDWTQDWYSIGLDKEFTFVTVTDGETQRFTETQKLPLEEMQGFEGFVFMPYSVFTDGSAPAVDLQSLAHTGWALEISLYSSFDDCVGRDYLFDNLGFYGDIDSYVEKCLDSVDNADYIFNNGEDPSLTVYGGSDISVSQSSGCFGGALKISPSKTYGGGWAQIPATVPEDYPLEAVRGIAMYVKIPEDSADAHLAVRLINSQWTKWFTLGYEKPVFTVGNDGITDTVVTDISCGLAGFEGFLFIPLSSLTDGSQPADMQIVAPDGWNVELGYYAKNDECVNADFIFDEIGFYSDIEGFISLARRKQDIYFEYTSDGYAVVEASSSAGALASALPAPYYDEVAVINSDGDRVQPAQPLASGMELCFIRDGEPAVKYKIALLNDINCDGGADIRDYVRLKRFLAGASDISFAGLRSMSRTGVRRDKVDASRLAILRKALLTGSGSVETIDKGSFDIIKDGTVCCKIVIKNGSSSAQTAARDLAARLTEMTGKDFPVYRDTQIVSGRLILVGASSYTDALGLEIPSGFPENEGYRIYSDSDVLLLAGNDSGCFTGTEFAVTRFLETLGFGWFGTDELWTVTPSSDTVSVPHTDIVSYPAFGSRYTNLNTSAYQLSKRWYLGGYKSEVDHKFGTLFPAETYYSEHPEYYALSNGTRSVEGKRWWQLCLSNPEVQQLTAEKCIDFFNRNPDYVGISIGQNDGSGDTQSADYANYCECDACHAFADSFTEAMMKFTNAVARIVKESYPDKTMMFYGYYSTFTAPDTDIAAEDNVLMMLCKQGGTTRFVSYQNLFNGLWGDSQFSENFKAWRALGYRHMGIYEWNCPGAASELWKSSFWVQGNVFAENARWFRNHGADFIKIDQGPNPYYERTEDLYGLRWPLWYVNSVLMYDCSRSFDEVMRQACETLYGDAADAMLEFYTVLTDAAHGCQNPCCAWELPAVGDVYSEQYISRADAAMSRALSLAGMIGGAVEQRIQNQADNWAATKTAANS